jgi:peptide/nickel transport system permease protein
MAPEASVRPSAGPPSRRGAAGRAPPWTLLRRHPLGVLALAFLIAFALAAGLAPTLAPFDPLAHDLGRRLAAPGGAHAMGTDGFGRDVLSRVLYGARASLAVAVLGVALATGIGTLVGVATAYAGGRVDLLVGRLTDALMAFPALVMALVLVAAFGPSQPLVVVAIVMALTPHLTRVARARCLELLERDHVLAARALGADDRRIVVRHLLPNVLPTVVVLAAGYVGNALVLEAALSYLGLGLPPPTPSWGRMIFEGAHLYLETASWLTVFPGLALASVVLAFTLLGDALRDALDPHLRHRAGARPDERGPGPGHPEA